MLDRTGYRRMLEQDRSPDSRNAPGEPERVDQRGHRGGRARRNRRPIFWTTRRWWPDADAFDEAAPVTLMTLHNAKGLEFPVVFLAGPGDWPFPAQPARWTPKRLWKKSGGCATWA